MTGGHDLLSHLYGIGQMIGLKSEAPLKIIHYAVCWEALTTKA
jgi:hypothetical protein